MISAGSLAIGLVVAAVFGSWLFRRLRNRGGDADRRSAERARSYERHREAQRREPPVEIGAEYVAGVEDFSTHHSGDRHAVCRVEGFVVFVEDLPRSLTEGEVIRFRVLSFNRGHTSASATYLGRE